MALNAYLKRMGADRRAYFKIHRRPRDRAAFLKRQQKKLAALRQAAACTVPSPAPVPPPAFPGAPFSPSLSKPSFADDRSSVRQPWVGEWGPKSDPYFLPGTGRLRGLIVPVDFVDAPATRSVEFYRDLLIPPAATWYRDASYGRLSLDLTIFSRWVRMSKPIAAYGLQNCCPDQATYDFMAELVGRIDPEVDFSQVDAIYAVGPESSGPNLNILLYRRWPGEGIVADGKELRWGVVGNGNFPSADTAYLLAHYMITHETGHLMGLADQYGRDCPTCADTHDWVGAWSMMDTANPPSAHFLAWDKWLLGWLTADQVRGLTGSGAIDGWLTPSEAPGGVKLLVVPTSDHTLYAVEVRRASGEDRMLSDQGVLVYTVDSSVRNGQGPIRLRQAHASDPSQVGRCGPIWNSAFDLGLGEVATYEDGTIKVDVLETDGTNYHVQVVRK